MPLDPAYKAGLARHETGQKFNHRAHGDYYYFMRLTEVSAAPLCALYIIILVYTTCYAKTIKLQIPKTKIRFETQELIKKQKSGFLEFQIIEYSFLRTQRIPRFGLATRP